MPKNTKTTAKEETATTKVTRSTKGTTKKEARVTPRTGKSQANKMLARVPEEKVFWCHDGQVLRDIRELRDALITMSDETYNYHSKEFKKDLSNWVRDIVATETGKRYGRVQFKRDGQSGYGRQMQPAMKKRRGLTLCKSR